MKLKKFEVTVMMLEVKEIVKRFGKFTAVDRVSFSAEEGIIFGLLGPNGAGKTTTIRMIMNIILPDSGHIHLFGKPFSGKATNSIGYLPEERGLYRKMKAGDLLLFLMELKEMNSREAKKKIGLWLERMDLTEWKNKKIEELSKGMQQKLQFIATIIHSPGLLILDEPFGGLDPVNSNLLKDILLEIKNGGTTILFSTHIMESAEKLCEEILLINKGKAVLQGRLGEIKKGYGRRNVFIEYEGKSAFLKKSKQISRFDDYGNAVEIQLIRNADTQQLLKEAVAGCNVKRFEVKEPSLNDIFIDTVKGIHTEEAHE